MHGKLPSIQKRWAGFCRGHKETVLRRFNAVARRWSYRVAPARLSRVLRGEPLAGLHAVRHPGSVTALSGKHRSRPCLFDLMDGEICLIAWSGNAVPGKVLCTGRTEPSMDPGRRCPAKFFASSPQALHTGGIPTLYTSVAPLTTIREASHWAGPRNLSLFANALLKSIPSTCVRYAG